MGEQRVLLGQFLVPVEAYRLKVPALDRVAQRAPAVAAGIRDELVWVLRFDRTERFPIVGDRHERLALLVERSRRNRTEVHHSLRALVCEPEFDPGVGVVGRLLEDFPRKRDVEAVVLHEVLDAETVAAEIACTRCQGPAGEY
ncbi:hypothetical protein BRC81_06495 [Halobacteriales archaeon QS_1_68_20]|nr:MAG: hypothetical protein BRC81_06495 [Halobacteriales archaeon QS_1_68_20]